LLKPSATRLVGVDLSTGMLQQAAKRDVYDELVEGDLTTYMGTHRSAFDVIVACDTLVYQGRLDDVLVAASTGLKPNGLLLFTLERLPEETGSGPYRLAPTGRFCHSAGYVQTTLTKFGFIRATTEAITPRLECGEPVDGLLVTARAPLLDHP
jgi:predicted TPR repeat methyltransferase